MIHILNNIKEERKKKSAKQQKSIKYDQEVGSGSTPSARRVGIHFLQMKSEVNLKDY